MKLCVIMDPWESIDPEWDTTLRLLHEAHGRGHVVAMTTPTNLTIRRTEAQALCSVITGADKPLNARTFYETAAIKRRLLPLAGFDVVMMRANPPLDTTTLNFLDSVKDDVFICNDINGLRIANNKIFTAALWDPTHDFIPETHVSKNADYLEQVYQDHPGDRMIMKPLDGYGGRGVMVIDKAVTPDLGAALHAFRGENGDAYVILQECVPGAEHGDIRILMLNGEAIGAMRRAPAEGEHRSNIAAGGTAVKHTLTREERALCRHIGPKLVREGLFFVGLDVIGGKLIEVNVLSPGGLTRINRLNRVRLQAKVIDFLESVVSAKAVLMARKSAFQRVIEEAVADV